MNRRRAAAVQEYEEEADKSENLNKDAFAESGETADSSAQSPTENSEEYNTVTESSDITDKGENV